MSLVPPPRPSAPGGFARRSLALIVDDALVFVSLPILLTLVGSLTGADGYWIGFALGYFFYLTIPVIALFWALAFVLSEWLTGGRTVGKALVGVAVRNADDGGRPRLGQLFARELTRVFYVLLLGIPFVLDGLAALRDPRGQTWHDRHSGTVVLRVRKPVGRLAADGRPPAAGGCDGGGDLPLSRGRQAPAAAGGALDG